MNNFIYKYKLYEDIHIKLTFINYMPINEPLKRVIEDIKLKNGITQAEIAKIIYIKSTYLSDMINGLVPFTANI